MICTSATFDFGNHVCNAALSQFISALVIGESVSAIGHLHNMQTHALRTTYWPSPAELASSGHEVRVLHEGSSDVLAFWKPFQCEPFSQSCEHRRTLERAATTVLHWMLMCVDGRGASIPGGTGNVVIEEVLRDL